MLSLRSLGLTVAIVAATLSVSGLNAVPAAAAATGGSPSVTAACSHISDSPGQCKSLSDGTLALSLPNGARQCPDSGTGASCSSMDGSSNDAVPGVASTPDGQTPCPTPAGATLSTPAACTDTVLPVGTVDTTSSSAHGPAVAPSVPLASLQPDAGVQRVSLTANATSLTANEKVVLTATAPAAVTGSGNAIEIFDQTAGTLAGACAQGGQCIVGYAANVGTHKFVAFIAPPTTTVPSNGTSGASNPIAVSWIGVTLDAKNPVVGPGKTVTLTATSTVAAASGLSLQLFDTTSNERITYCTRGNTCSISVTQPAAGERSVVAVLAAPSSTLPAAQTRAESSPLTVTWLGVDIAASSTYQLGTNVYLTATANVDLTNTPWSLGILDDRGYLVGQPCKSGTTCTAQVTLDSGSTPTFSAIIGAEPPADVQGKLGQLMQKVTGPSALVDIQARSASMKPNRLLWGVDSCKSFTGDPSGELYPKISGGLGTPDFWGRYLTDAVCPPLSSTEVALAHDAHMGILPIYNERDCSNVSGYDTGKAYAAEAVAAAGALGIPEGRSIVIDIEPPGPACPGAVNVDAGLVSGWYDGITAAHYVPTYYANGTPGKEFAGAWCAAVSARPEIATNSFLWSFQPSLLGDFGRAGAPGFGPYSTGCGANFAAWQYQIDIYSRTPDVDQDEALSALPIWYP